MLYKKTSQEKRLKAKNLKQNILHCYTTYYDIIREAYFEYVISRP